MHSPIPNQPLPSKGKNSSGTTFLSIGICLLAIFTTNTRAEDGLFLADITQHLTPAEINQQVQRSFRGRQWQSARITEKGVTGKIQHRGVDATLTIFQVENDLYYHCEGTRTKEYRRPNGGVRSFSKTVTITSEFCPHKWLDNLRLDLQSLLQS